jgi:hypothetical protein
MTGGRSSGCEGEVGGAEGLMIFNTEEKLEEILGGLSSDTLDEIYDELHEVLCKSIIDLLQDSIVGPGISEQQMADQKNLGNY